MLRKLPDDIDKITEPDSGVKKMRTHFTSPARFSIAVRGINEKLFFLLLLVYHVAITFQGIDLLDEGFHAVFYQRIFDDPSSVQYNFFYWFSGIVGGGILKLLPGLGLWGLRLAGAITSILTILITYRLLRKIIPRGILQVGIAILALYINSEPKDIHYNTLSALFFFSAAALMLYGLKRKNNFMLFLCGAVLGLNVFTRLPNILGAGMALAIIYSGLIEKISIRDIVGRIAVFMAGFIISIGVIIYVMHSIGHLDIFIDSIKFIFSLTTTTGKQDGLAGSYGFGRLIYVLIKQHGISLSIVVFLTGLVLLYRVVLDVALSVTGNRFRFDMFFGIVVSIIALGLIFTDRIHIQYLTYLFTGFCVITSIITLSGSYTNYVKLLSFLGLFIMLIHPFGSAPGILTVMLYSMWISFPMGIALLQNVVHKKFEIQISIGSQNWKLFITNEAFLKKVLLWFMAMILIICLRYIIEFPYFYDQHSRTEMVYQINSPNTRFIYTSKQRATALNELLASSEKYVKKGDVVLAYDAIPMYYFMTEAKPFMPNSTPLFYTSIQFSVDLQKSLVKSGLPVIVKQEIWTIHEGSGWPENIVELSPLEAPLNKLRDSTLNLFLSDHRYKKVWSNKIFSILVPENRSYGATSVSGSK